ncbi:unnamed protein product, partial [Allacma fusca]
NKVDENRNNWRRVKTLTVSPSRHTDDRHFPKEKVKTVLAFLFLTVSFVLNATSIALTHDRVPDRD